MRRYLLDTSPLAAFLNGRPEAISALMPWIDAREAATSIIVYGEIVEYFLGRPDFAERDRNLRGVLQIITPLFLSYATLR